MRRGLWILVVIAIIAAGLTLAFRQTGDGLDAEIASIQAMTDAAERSSAALAFVLGHEAGDLLWYGLISTMVFLGRRHINLGLYRALLVVCGVFMAGFGLYLGIGPLAGQGL